MATKKKVKKKTEKKVVVVEELTLYKAFADEVSEIHYKLFNLREDAFNGEVTHKELIERLFELCHSIDKALDTVEGVEDGGYNFDDEDDDFTFHWE